MTDTTCASSFSRSWSRVICSSTHSQRCSIQQFQRGRTSSSTTQRRQGPALSNGRSSSSSNANATADAFRFDLPLVVSNRRLFRPIFNKFQHHLIEDFLHLNFNREDAINQCLNQLEAVFTQQGKHCTHFGLPAPVMQTFGSIGHNFNVEHERVVANEYMSKLNEEQRSVVEKVLQSVDKVSKQTAFFIDGPGGTGKTFCYSAITHRLRSQGKNVISVA